MAQDTPIALFIFNRPETTLRVFETVALAKPARLFIIADGPRFPEEEVLCQQARAVVDQIDWDCQVLTNISEQNMGCKKRVSSGLDWVFQQCEEAIILEDDCVPHPDFFDFCARMLDRYRDDERVMMVAGMNYLCNRLRLRESYTFSRYFPVWGWATWRRAWENYDGTMEDWPSKKTQKQLQNMYGPNGLSRYLEMVFDAALNMDTWAVRWLYSCVFQNGLSVVPAVNLVSNIGVVGTHSSREDDHHHLPIFPMPTENLVHPGQVFPNALYDDILARRILMPLVPSPLEQTVRKGGRTVKRRLSFIFHRLQSERRY